MTVAVERLHRTWESESALVVFFATVDHKRIGKRYMGTTALFFLAGGIEALLMRAQLLRPNNDVLTPDQYNQIFTMHGTTMIFLVVMPMLTGAFGNYFVPLMIGARDMAFPRLNALSYWIFLASGCFIYFSFLLAEMPNGGWFAYVPLTTDEYLPGRGMDFWALGLIFLGISTTIGAVNFIVTIFTMRAPGMSLNRMPLFVWAILTTAFAVVFALPPLTLDAALLEFDRQYGMHFFDVSAGGSALLWQHLFWSFGHPDVYIMFLPTVGIVSTLIAMFSGRSVVGYTLLALATVATGFLGFGVWVHHMFATGLPFLPLSFFAVVSLIIVIPSGIQVFAWIATLWTGRPRFEVPMLFALGFIAVFVMGGVTGVMVAMIPLDLQVTDSYFVVAHFHYVLVGSSMFGILAGISYWIPKVTGRLPISWLGHTAFWWVFIGFNVTFFPMHISGLLGMPRRIYTYQDGLGWDGLNLLSTIGSYVLAGGLFAFVAYVVSAWWSGQRSGDNPWDASTLEWATSSPPPPYNFREVPTVQSADPLWYHDGAPADSQAAVDYLSRQHGDQREVAITTPIEANPSAIVEFPSASLWPIFLAASLTVFFVGIISDLPALWVAGGVAAAAGIAGWSWPVEGKDLS